MKNLFIGIDFSKEKIDATIIVANGLVELSERVSSEFMSTKKDYRRFVKWVEKHSYGIDVSAWLFCGENTGDYSKPLCNYLYGEGYDMWLENAKSIKESSGLRRLKTDRADSTMIAEYAMRNYDRAQYYKPLSNSLSHLRELFLYRHMIVRHKSSFQVRRGEKDLILEKSPTKRLISNTGKHLIRECEKVIAKLDQQIKELIDSDEILKQTYNIVTSVPGIGVQNAVCLIVYTENFTKFDFNARKIACYYGVAPFGKESGTSVFSAPKTHYMANKLIKSILTQGALIAIKHCEQIKQYYLRLINKGKKSQVALNNVKNKLLRLITALVKNNALYDSNYINKYQTALFTT